MFRSLRWTLQLWHAALLAVVLAVVGTVVFYGASRNRYMDVDLTLSRSAQQLASGLRPSMEDRFRQPFDGSRPPDQGGPGPMDDGGPPDRRQPPRVVLSDELFRPFDDGESGNMYCVIWQNGRGLIKTTRRADDVPDPGERPEGSRPSGPQPPQPRHRGDLWEAFTYGPFGTRIVVGKSIAPDRAAMTHLAWTLAAMSAGVLLMGLAGGWVLSGRVLRPIRAITTVAQDISASNLSRRIDVAEAHSELGALAAVLNESFSRLEAAFAQQARFTADASHELRTPLTVIHSNLQLALSRPRTAEEYRATLETCQRASGRMKELVDSLLLLAKADAGGLALDKSACDLHRVVDESVAMVRPLASEKGVAIETDLRPVSLSADAARMGQVAVNLLTNAIRYNAPGGTVRVATRREEGEAVLKVADTGTGISPQHQDHIFERFFRVDEARSRQAGGTGLGLAICKSIVEAHGGVIRCSSELGKGTTFTVRLPGPYI